MEQPGAGRKREKQQRDDPAQSIAALLARLGGEPGALWLLLSAMVLAATVSGMRRALDAGQHALALGLNALGALLVSPVSWSHHWVWAVPILLTAGITARRSRSRPALALTAGATLLVVLSPHSWWDNHDPWNFGRLLTGNAYLWVAALMVVLSADISRRERLSAAGGS